MCCSVAAALFCCAGAAFGQASFRLLQPDEGFDYSVVQDVSADGTKVLVSLQNSVPRPTTPFTYVLDLRDDSRIDIIDPFNRTINGLALNADGTVVAGYMGGGPLQGSSAFVWYAADSELVEIWGLPVGNLHYAVGISADGTTVVGSSATNFGDPYQQGWRWTLEGGFVPLHCLGEPDVIFSGVNGVSDDGSTVVGYGSSLFVFEDPEEPPEVIYPRGSVWPEGGTVPFELPPMPNPFNGGLEATAASDDGSVVVGSGPAFNPSGGFANHSFRWTADTGVVDLGVIPDQPNASIYAMDCSADGNTIVGHYNNGGVNTWEAFVWTQADGFRSLRQILADSGVVIPEDVRLRETYTSNDGRVIAGWAYVMSENRYYGYVATLGDGAACPADWNGDAEINSSDISAFLTAWLASVTAPDLTADFNQDGATNSSDISAFLTAWLDAVTGGC